MDRDPLLHRDVDRRRRGAVIDGRQPAGIAVCQDVDRLARLLALGDLADDLEPVAANGAVELDVVVGHLGRAGISGLGATSGRKRLERLAHLVQRPAQVDRGRPRRVQRLPGRVEGCIGRVVAHLQRDPVGRRHADQGCAAHPHVADRGRHLGHRVQRHDTELVRQPALVDDVDRASVLVQPDGSEMAFADLHVSVSLLAAFRAAVRPRQYGVSPPSMLIA